MKANSAVLVFFCAILKWATCQLPSPCPNILKYEERDEQSSLWYATLILTAPEDLDGVWVEINLDRSTEELATKFGEVSTLNNKDFLVTNDNYNFVRGTRLTVKMSVKYNQLEILPSVVKIRLNGRLICDNKNVSNEGGFIPRAVISTKQSSTLNCGKVSRHDQWPWSVAILLLNDDDSLKFQCGGVLVSDDHVLTTSHCVVNFKKKTLEASKFLVYLGTHKIKRPGPALQIGQVSDIFTNPGYNPAYNSDDIAILKLRRPVERSDYVSPVCLPEKNRDVIGKTGTLVSWGLNDVNNTVNMQVVRMPVVSTDTCRKFDREFYERYTSSNTLCSEYASGTYTCLGSSGSGLVFKSGSETSWQLHGIAALAKPAQDHRGCVPNGYVILMNVARYVDWIKATAQLK